MADGPDELRSRVELAEAEALASEVSARWQVSQRVASDLRTGCCAGASPRPTAGGDGSCLYWLRASIMAARPAARAPSDRLRERVAKGAVWAAATIGDVDGLRSALSAGGATEEEDSVSCTCIRSDIFHEILLQPAVRESERRDRHFGGGASRAHAGCACPHSGGGRPPSHHAGAGSDFL